MCRVKNLAGAENAANQEAKNLVCEKKRGPSRPRVGVRGSGTEVATTSTVSQKRVGV